MAWAEDGPVAAPAPGGESAVSGGSNAAGTTAEQLTPRTAQAVPPAQDAAPADSEAGRILGIIPDNKIVPSTKKDTEEPLTARQKYWLATKDTIDPYTFVLAGFYAGIAQWQHDYPSWQQGGAGYGRRFGAAYADQAVGNYLTEGILPALLHEDPRYFRKGTGSGWARTAYALSRVLITPTDCQKTEFNYSEIVGNAAAAGISNLYYPRSEATLGETGEKFAVQMVSDAAFNILLEFWPDMRRSVFRHVPLLH